MLWLGVLAAGPLARAQDTPPPPAPGPTNPAGVIYRVVPGDAQLLLISDAPLERIVAVSRAVTGRAVAPTDGRPAAQLLTARFEAPAGSITTGDERRDARHRSGRWLNADDFPLITLIIDETRDPAPAPDPGDPSRPITGAETFTATLAGRLSFRGVTRPVEFPALLTVLPESAVTRRKAPGDLLVLRARLPIRLRDFEVNDPAVSAGLVAEIVTADLVLLLSDSEPGPLGVRP